MKANRNQSVASPRFSRGLALVALTGALALLVYTSLPKRAASDGTATAVDSIAGTPQPQEVRRATAAPQVFQVSVSRANGWGNAFAAIEAEPDLGVREERWADLLARISPADIPVMLAELQTAGLGAHEFTQRLLRRWAEADGRAAATWAEQLPPSAARDGALSGVAVEWANTSLAEAAGWAKTLGDETERNAVVTTVAGEAVRTEPVEALRLAVELPDTPQRDDLIHRAATEWAVQDPAGAVAWAEQIPDEALRAKVLAGEAVSWAEQDPETAATLAVEKLPAGRVQEDTVISIIQRWAQQQPEAAAAWAAQFPPGELKVAAIENVATMWSLQDSQSAEAWRSSVNAPTSAN